MKTYDLALLSGAYDPTLLNQARTKARLWAKDYPNPGWPTHSIEDEEWDSYLQDTSAVSKNALGEVVATYYRPHEAVCAVLEGNPFTKSNWSMFGVSETYRDLSEALSAIRKNGAFIDSTIAELISEAGLVRITPQFQLEARF